MLSWVYTHTNTHFHPGTGTRVCFYLGDLFQVSSGKLDDDDDEVVSVVQNRPSTVIPWW